MTHRPFRSRTDAPLRIEALTGRSASQYSVRPTELGVSGTCRWSGCVRHFRTRREAPALEAHPARLPEREVTPRGRSVGARRSRSGIAVQLTDPAVVVGMRTLWSTARSSRIALGRGDGRHPVPTLPQRPRVSRRRFSAHLERSPAPHPGPAACVRPERNRASHRCAVSRVPLGRLNSRKGNPG